MKRIKVLQIDAFTNRPYSGNPAAVCLLDEQRDEAWMQSVANEMNLSETAFPSACEDGFSLRWFTPTSEVDLCGHATLAAAHALWTTQSADETLPIRFLTKSGPLVCSRRDDFIEMDFPALPIRQAEPPAGLVEAMGVEPVFCGKSQFDVLLEFGSEDVIRSLEPDFTKLRTVPARGIIATSRSLDPAFDFLSRFFAPSVGVDEDPVTGSAHCSLGPFWSERLGKTEMTALQASSRSGVVNVRVAGERVVIGGRAVTVLEGYLVAA